MPNNRTIPKHRRTAYLRQSGRCFYCGQAMWSKRPELFARAHGLTPVQAAARRCTAEHVVARRDGGSNVAQNIVAACLRCNQRRHACVKPLASDAYREQVRREALAGR